ncbi:MAG: HAMP domain-containing protein [Desulfurivibrio sp.]|nr:HAMP domain-containing protein [Desulfurivibrio sp.]
MLTGVITFLLVALVLSLIVQRYVHRPMQRLEEGFIQVGRGNFDHWVEIGVEGELKDMAVQFNVMNQAIKRSFAEIKSKTGKPNSSTPLSAA